MTEATSTLTRAEAVKVVESGRPVLSDKSGPYDFSLFLDDLGHDNQGDPKNLQATLRYVDKLTHAATFISWRAGVSLAGLKDGARAFEKLVGSTDNADGLADAGYQLGHLLFDPFPPGDPDTALAEKDNSDRAEQARQALLSAAKYGDSELPPTMIVRIVSTQRDGSEINASTVVPIGAIGIGNSNSLDKDAVFLGQRFAIGLALSGARFLSGETCPANWYFALPKAPDGLAPAIQDALKDLKPVLTPWPSSIPKRQSISLQELKAWIGTRSSADSETYVFSYLGHHDEGHLYLQTGGAVGLSPGGILRNFHGTSIAILDACTSAMDHVSNGTLVGMLQSHQIASVIATTSEVSGHLAAAYMDCMGLVLARQPKLSIGQANVLTTQCLWSKEQGKRWGGKYAYKAAALKYVLIGNPQQSICKPREDTRQ